MKPKTPNTNERVQKFIAMYKFRPLVKSAKITAIGDAHYGHEEDFSEHFRIVKILERHNHEN